MRLTTSVIALSAMAGTAFADTIVTVTTTDDLRTALETAATSDQATRVLLISDDIEIDRTLTYTGTAPLAVIGQGQTIKAVENVTILAATNGADLQVANLTLEGPSGYSIDARGDASGPAGKGIFVDVRDDQTGLVQLQLDNVTIANTAGHGVHVSDCTLADDCGGGGGGAGEGSPASISVRFANVTIDTVGQGRFDADGLRVDERDQGSIHFVASNSLFTGVGADGAELDEGQDGDVVVRVSGTRFVGNGDYCDPARLDAFMPTEPEGEFEKGALAEADVPLAVSGSPDDACFEREVDTYDDGTVEEYEFAIDVDDGFDVDEAGGGSIIATITDTVIDNNFDEGLDFDEEGAGDIDITLIGVTGSGNTDDAFKHSEEDEGSISGIVVGGIAKDNGGVGIVFEEENGGDVSVVLSRVNTSGNDDGETGIEIVQDDEGVGELLMSGSSFDDGQEIEGVQTSTN